MKTRYTLAGAAIFALAACGTPAGNESGEANNSAVVADPMPPAANDAKPADNATSDAAAPAGDGALTRDYLVGRWTNSGDCGDAIEFRADGSMTGPFGETAQWELRGDQLFMVGNPDPLTVVVIDQATMQTTNPGGTQRRATRC